MELPVVAVWDCGCCWAAAPCSTFAFASASAFSFATFESFTALAALAIASASRALTAFANASRVFSS